MYLLPGPVTPVTSPVNTGFFEHQPVSNLCTTCDKTPPGGVKCGVACGVREGSECVYKAFRPESLCGCPGGKLTGCLRGDGSPKAGVMTAEPTATYRNLP